MSHVRTVCLTGDVAQGLDYNAKKITADDWLNAAAQNTLIAVVEALADKLERVTLVGHNPGFKELAVISTAQLPPMPTCVIAEFKSGTKA